MRHDVPLVSTMMRRTPAHRCDCINFSKPVKPDLTEYHHAACILVVHVEGHIRLLESETTVNKNNENLISNLAFPSLQRILR